MLVACSLRNKVEIIHAHFIFFKIFLAKIFSHVPFCKTCFCWKSIFLRNLIRPLAAKKVHLFEATVVALKGMRICPFMVNRDIVARYLNIPWEMTVETEVSRYFWIFARLCFGEWAAYREHKKIAWVFCLYCHVLSKNIDMFFKGL